MTRPCASCTSAHRAEIDKKIKAGATYDDVSRWLKDVHNVGISSTAISRHVRHSAGLVPRQRGPQPLSEDFLVAVRDKAHENIRTGESKVTVQHGLQAQAQLDQRAKQSEDKSLLIIIAQVLGGAGVPEAIDADFTELPMLEAGE